MSIPSIISAPQQTRKVLFRQLLRWLVLAVILASLVWYLRVGRQPEHPSSSMIRELDPANLKVAPESLLFGEVWEDKQFPWSLEITNRGSTMANIERFHSSCACTAIQPEALTIPPGESRKVKLTLDLTHRSDKTRNQSQRDFAVNLAPMLRTDAGSIRGDYWTLRGTVRSVLSFTPPVLDFGACSEKAQPLAPRTAQLQALAPVGQVRIAEGPSLLLGQVRPGESANTFTLQFAPRNPLPIGPFQQEVLIFADKPAGADTYPPQRLLVRGEIVDDFQFSTPAIVFGAQPLNSTCEETISLHSLTGRPFQVKTMETQGAGLTIKRLNNESNHEFVVKQQILALGKQSTKLVFHIDTNDNQSTSIDCAVNYHGLKAK